MAKFGFDVSEVEVSQPAGPREPVPAGEYTLKALEANEKSTSTGGEMISAKFEVVGGDHDGRWIWQNFNTVNKSPKAQSIGRSQLVAWAAACGKPGADDTDKLIDKPFKAIVDIEAGSGGYGDRNVIKSFVTGDAAPKAAPKAAPTKPVEAPAEAKKKNPWD
jgi:hypothetical protein